jgi:hypothetical protein
MLFLAKLNIIVATQIVILYSDQYLYWKDFTRFRGLILFFSS